jgi:hypothetical protein
MEKITISNTYMIKSVQLAIILAFTAPLEIKIEQMVVMLVFCLMMKNNDNIILCLYKINLLNHDKQMVTPFNKRKFEIMVVAKLSIILLLQTLLAF